MIDNSGYTVTVNGYAECLNYVNGGYYVNSNVYIEDRTPRYNNFALYLTVVSLILILFVSIKRKIQN